MVRKVLARADIFTGKSKVFVPLELLTCLITPTKNQVTAEQREAAPGLLGPNNYKSILNECYIFSG